MALSLYFKPVSSSSSSNSSSTTKHLPAIPKPPPPPPGLQLPSTFTTLPSQTPTPPTTTTSTKSQSNATPPPLPTSISPFPPSQTPTSTSNPHPSISILAPSTHHLPRLRLITTTLLPIRYPENFFTTTITDPITHSLSRVAIDSISSGEAANVIGAIRCRLEPYSGTASTLAQSQRLPQEREYTQLYIATLLLLPSYRGYGIATALLDSLLSSDILRHYGIRRVYAHVWERNEEALGWYERRGFRRGFGDENEPVPEKEEGFVESYYRKLRPGGAWIVCLDLEGRWMSVMEE